MRISDWSSDVCSSDLAVLDPGTGTARIPAPLDAADVPKITIVAAGTSYYAGLAARYWMESLAGIATEVELASAFRDRDAVLPQGGVASAVSASGGRLEIGGASGRGRVCPYA